MLGPANQRKNQPNLMEMKPQRKSLGRNPLSDAPYRNPGMVLNGQGPGRHPLGGASCRDLDAVSSEQGSGRCFLSDCPSSYPPTKVLVDRLVCLL